MYLNRWSTQKNREIQLLMVTEKSFFNSFPFFDLLKVETHFLSSGLLLLVRLVEIKVKYYYDYVKKLCTCQRL